MARSLIPRRNISVHRSNSSAPSRSLRPLRGIFYGRKISISQCHVVRLPQIIGTHSMQTVQWWPTVAYVTITLHAIRTCEYCPPQHLCHLSCAVHEMCNTKLKQTLLSSVHIDPYTKQAVFPVIVHSYTRRLAALIPGISVVEPSEKKLGATLRAVLIPYFFFILSCTVYRQAERVEQARRLRKYALRQGLY